MFVLTFPVLRRFSLTENEMKYETQELRSSASSSFLNLNSLEKFCFLFYYLQAADRCHQSLVFQMEGRKHFGSLRHFLKHLSSILWCLCMLLFSSEQVTQFPTFPMIFFVLFYLYSDFLGSPSGLFEYTSSLPFVRTFHNESACGSTPASKLLPFLGFDNLYVLLKSSVHVWLSLVSPLWLSKALWCSYVFYEYHYYFITFSLIRVQYTVAIPPLVSWMNWMPRQATDAFS